MNPSKFNQKIICKLTSNLLPQYYKTCASLLIPCKDDLKSCIKNVKIGGVPNSRCDRMKEALEKCPKIPSTKDCSSKIIPDPSVPKIESASNMYLKAQKAIKSKAEELKRFLETSKNAILKDMKKQTDAARLQDLEDMRKILCSIDKKMKILIDLDMRCAQSNKLNVLKLNEKAHESISACVLSTELAYNNLKEEIENLIDDTCSKIDGIMETMGTCKGSKTPESLENCVTSKGTEAVGLLDEVDKKARKKIGEFEEAKEGTMSNRKLMSRRISKEYQKETTDLSVKLSQHIKSLESKSKKK